MAQEAKCRNIALVGASGHGKTSFVHHISATNTVCDYKTSYRNHFHGCVIDQDGEQLAVTLSDTPGTA